MNYTLDHVAVLRTFAQAYGSDAYGASTYSCAEGEVCTTESPLAPVTGFLRDQPPTIVVPVLLVAAVLLAAVGLLIGKLVAKLRRN